MDQVINTATTTIGPVKDARNLRGPTQILMESIDNGTDPVTSSLTCTVQHATRKDGAFLDYQAGAAMVTEAGEIIDVTNAEPIGPWIRVSVASTFGTPNDGLRLRVVICGS
jgi:hypothetical protein